MTAAATIVDRRHVFALVVLGGLEKLAFNGIRASLVLYLTRSWSLSDGRAFGVYATVMALGFVLPIVTGIASDRWLGSARSLLAGSLLALVGALSLVVRTWTALHVGLGLLVLGSAFLKSSVPTLLGRVASVDPPRRDAMFALLYLGFNVGGLAGVVGCAVVGELVSWRVAFLVCAGAMLAAAALAAVEQRSLATVDGRDAGKQKEEEAAARKGAQRSSLAANLAKLGGLMALHTVFFALYEQASLSLTLFADRNVDRSLGAWIAPASAFQAVDPLLNVTLGGFFAVLWAKLAQRSERESYFVKLAAGLLVIGAAFWLLTLPKPADGRVSSSILVVTYALFVVGEQCVVPIGMSAVAALAPRRHLGLFMGVWLLSIAGAVWLAGLFSRITEGAGDAGLSTAASLSVYQRGFALLAIAPSTLGAFVLLVAVLDGWGARREGSSWSAARSTRSSASRSHPRRSLGRTRRT